jgi:acyl phosphate:glycerol-3-phosphate acyltransferase
MIEDKMVILTLLLLLASYVLGSFPTAHLVGRYHGVDLRDTGDGNLGGLNTYHVLGLKPALLVGLVDIGKGLLAVWLAVTFSTNTVVPYLAALASAIGHDFSIFVHFQGGQGMGSIIGSLVYLHPLETLLGITLFLLCFLLFHNWDVAWIAGMVTIIGTAWYRGSPLLTLCLIIILIVTIGIKKWMDLPVARRLKARQQ